MKNSAIKQLFAIQKNCQVDDIDVEFVSCEGNVYEFNVDIKDNERGFFETLVFKCESEEKTQYSLEDTIIIDLYRGVLDNVQLPHGVDSYLVRDYDIEEQDQQFRHIPENEYPSLVIDIEGGMITNVNNKTGFKYVINDHD